MSEFNLDVTFQRMCERMQSQFSHLEDQLSVEKDELYNLHRKGELEEIVDKSYSLHGYCDLKHLARYDFARAYEFYLDALEMFKLKDFDGALDNLFIASSLAGLATGSSEEKHQKYRQMSTIAKSRLADDPIQLAKKEIEKEYQSVKNQFKRRGFTAQFNRDMHIKYPDITDIKTIERLTATLNKANELIPHKPAKRVVS